MKTITFYSYKGGVGRTLALSNIAKRLNEFGKKVFIIDFDLEAPGVHYKFKDFLRHDNIKQGLVDYIYEFCVNNQVDSDLNKYVRAFRINSRSKNQINLMCAGNNSSSEYWKKLSSINWHDMFYKEESEGIEFFLNLKELIQKKYNPDYLLIDSRTGFTETSAITMSILADEVMILSANNLENIEGSKQIIKSINRTKSLTNHKIKTHFVLTRIPVGNSPEDKITKNKIINQVDYQLNSEGNTDKRLVETIYVIHTDRELEIEETLKIGTDFKPGSISISNDYFKILKVIGNFTEDELNNYNSILKSDQIYLKALRLSRASEAFKNELDIALKLNKNNVEAMNQLAIYYFRNLLIKEEISILRKAIANEPNNTNLLSRLGASLVSLYRFTNDTKYSKEGIIYLEKAVKINNENKRVDIINEVVYFHSLEAVNKLSNEELTNLFDRLLSRFPNSQVVYNSMAVYYQEMGNIELAYEFIYKALEQDSGNATFKTTLAEIHSRNGKENEFYYNIDLALKSHYGIEGFFYYSKFYSAFFEDEKFLKLLDKYNGLDKFNELLVRFNHLTGKEDSNN